MRNVIVELDEIVSHITKEIEIDPDVDFFSIIIDTCEKFDTDIDDLTEYITKVPSFKSYLASKLSQQNYGNNLYKTDSEEDILQTSF